MTKVNSSSLTSVLVITCLLSFGQSNKYSDATSIRNHPLYDVLQLRLDSISNEWRSDLNAKFEEIAILQNTIHSDSDKMTDFQRSEIRNKIALKTKEVLSLHHKRFGQAGDLFKMRQDFVKQTTG